MVYTVSSFFIHNDRCKMEFCVENLSILACSSGFTLWLYRAVSDSKSVFANPRFFQKAGDMMNCGDIVMISARDGSRLLSVLMDEEGARTVATV